MRQYPGYTWGRPRRRPEGGCFGYMTRVLSISGDAARESAPEIREAARVLLSGGLALIPTETVYGIGVAVSAVPPSGDPSAEDAPAPLVNGCPVPGRQSGYRRIFDLKQRNLAQTVPWLVADAGALDEFGASPDPRMRALARSLWPGALTLIVPASDAVPRFMRAADGTVALRASASPVVAALIAACGCPLAVTSANTHGRPAPTSFSEVERRILEGVDIAIDAGETRCKDASTIVALPSGNLKIVRQGALPAEAIASAVASCEGPSAPSSTER